MTLPCTTSRRYGVMKPSTLSEDCSDLQPVRAKLAITVASTPPRLCMQWERRNVMGLRGRAGGPPRPGYERSILALAPVSTTCRGATAFAHDACRRTEKQRI